MNVRRLAGVAVAAGMLVSGLSLAPAATAVAESPKKKCDPVSGTRVAHSDSNRQRVNGRGCVEIEKLDNGEARVTGSIYAAARDKRGARWRLVAHDYEFSCELSGRQAVGGFAIKSENSGVSRSNGRTAGPCVLAKVSPGTYVFHWSYDRRGAAPGVDGEVEFTVEGNRLVEIFVRPMPRIQSD